MPIETPQDLRAHIELAIQIELATIPAYLYAMYSIEDQESEAALLIRSIATEEMLHAALATNLLLAVGGEPRFASTDWIPTYPMMVPHHRPPLEVGLAPASEDVIREVFMRIEQPEVHGAPPEPDMFETLGQFYHALEVAIGDLGERYALFADPQVERQMADPSFYSPVAYDAEDSGGLMLIDDADSARAAIEVIVHQGEGLSTDRWADPAHQELTHYHKLLQIAEGDSPLGAVRPLRAGPRSADYPEPLRQVSELFNAANRYMFLVMDELFAPTAEKGDDVGRLYGVMAGVMSELAHFLVVQPLDDATVASPTFEVHEFASGDVAAELIDRAAGVAGHYPELAGMAGRLTDLCRR